MQRHGRAPGHVGGLGQRGACDLPEGQRGVEPGQRPSFEEITVVLRGMLRVEHDGGAIDVRAGQAVVSLPGEWIRYSSPEPGGAEYVAICLPAFSMDTVHRDDD